MVAYLFESGLAPIPADAAYYAAKNMDRETLVYVTENGPPAQFACEKVCTECVSWGRIELLRFVNEAGFVLSGSSLWKATKRNRLDLVRYCCEEGKLTVSGEEIAEMARTSDPTILTYLQARAVSPSPDTVSRKIVALADRLKDE